MEKWRMNRYHIAAIAVLFTLCLPSLVVAQFYPGYGYGYGGYGDGGAALLGADARQAAVIQARADSRIAGQQAAMNQNAVVQSGIRSTLTNQAQGRADAISSQRQANQDWWYQQQAQQTAERNALYAEKAAAAPTSGWGSYGAVRSGFGPSGAPPPANMDIIKWPTLLQEQCFASERTKIEAPYRRTPPKLSPPTIADYRQMTRTVEDMKAVLEWRLSEGADTNEYNTAKAFLNKLGQEVAARANSAS
jgi:hypothetical protein